MKTMNQKKREIQFTEGTSLISAILFISVLETCMDYILLLERSCENLNFPPICLLNDWEKSSYAGCSDV